MRFNPWNPLVIAPIALSSYALETSLWSTKHFQLSTIDSLYGTIPSVYPAFPFHLRPLKSTLSTWRWSPTFAQILPLCSKPPFSGAQLWPHSVYFWAVLGQATGSLSIAYVSGISDLQSESLVGTFQNHEKKIANCFLQLGNYALVLWTL